jgi:hypothetical protein
VVGQWPERRYPVPKGYEKMRDRFKKSGLSDEAAKAKAARIWNAAHPENPVGPHQHGKSRKKK